MEPLSKRKVLKRGRPRRRGKLSKECPIRWVEALQRPQ